MFYRRSIKLSYLLSIAVHLVLILAFMVINFSIEHEVEEFVTVGFGTFGKMNSTGTLGDNANSTKEIKNPASKREVTRLEEKKVEVPLTKNSDTENLVTKRKEEIEETIQSPRVKPLNDPNDNEGRENTGDDQGSFGFEIDFGGKGIRKIYSYSLPEYPEGVSKEIDVKLRFSILPDGTVGKIFPMIKADTRLEMAAIYSLRQWRFEPLRTNGRQIEQTAIIVFPYRLQ